MSEKTKLHHKEACLFD